MFYTVVYNRERTTCFLWFNVKSNSNSHRNKNKCFSPFNNTKSQQQCPQKHHHHHLNLTPLCPSTVSFQDPPRIALSLPSLNAPLLPSSKKPKLNWSKPVNKKLPTMNPFSTAIKCFPRLPQQVTTAPTPSKTAKASNLHRDL